MRYSVPAIRQFFDYLATLRWLAEKVIHDGYEPDAEETRDKGHDLTELYRIGVEHGLPEKDVTALLLRPVWNNRERVA